MFMSKSHYCDTPQAAILLQVTPLCQLDGESVAMLEMLSEESLVCDDALHDIYQGKRAHCLTFISCEQAQSLMEILVGFECGFSTEQLIETLL